MGAYEIIKDAILIAQKADNAPLMQALLDAQQQALALQEECAKLKEQIKELQDAKELEKRITRCKKTIVTLSGDEQVIPYCSICWDKDKNLVQVKIFYNGDSECHVCKNYIYK